MLDDQINWPVTPLSVWDRDNFLSSVFLNSFSLYNHQHLLSESSQFLVDPEEVQLPSSAELPRLPSQPTQGKPYLTRCTPNLAFAKMHLSRLVPLHCIFFLERAHRNKTLLLNKTEPGASLQCFVL